MSVEVEFPGAITRNHILQNAGAHFAETSVFMARALETSSGYFFHPRRLSPTFISAPLAVAANGADK